MSNDRFDVLDRLAPLFEAPEPSFEAFLCLRDRKRRNQRIAAGVVGIAVFVAAVWIVTSGGAFDRSETSVVPGGDVTGPAETGPAETGPAETGFGTGGQGAPGTLPVSVTDYLVDLETGARTPLPESIVGTEDVTSAYAVSPDGSRLAYVRRGGHGAVGIFVANLDGTGIEQVTVELRGGAAPSGWAAPAWSRTARRSPISGAAATSTCWTSRRACPRRSRTIRVTMWSRSRSLRTDCPSSTTFGEVTQASPDRSGRRGRERAVGARRQQRGLPPAVAGWFAPVLLLRRRMASGSLLGERRRNRRQGARCVKRKPGELVARRNADRVLDVAVRCVRRGCCNR